MTDGEKILLEEIRGLRRSMEAGFNIVHKKVDDNDKLVTEKINKVENMALVSKTKMGTFIAGTTFAFTGLGTFLAHWVKSKFFQ